MLPASSYCLILILSCYLAGKIPVLLNRTSGESEFLHYIKTTHIKHILTSKKFSQHISQSRILNLEKHFIYLEDIRTEITPQQKISGLSKYFFRKFSNKLDPTAVIVFTSGFEKLPKAVPLSHYNITENIQYATQRIKLTQEDKILSILPPFHSLGFTS